MAGGQNVDARPTVEGEEESRLAFTPEAVALIDQLWAMHGPLMFHQSGGCCDGSAPMCYQAGEFKTGGQDVLLGVLELPPLGGAGGALVVAIRRRERSTSGCPANSSACGSTPT